MHGEGTIPMRDVEQPYYRLQQTDFDGGFTYSKVVPVVVNADSEVYTFPNPVQGQVTLTFIASTPENGVIVVFDQAGRKVFSQYEPLRAGLNMVVIHLEQLSGGVYWIQVQLGAKVLNTTVVKM